MAETVTMTRDCPHCGAADAAFTYRAEASIAKPHLPYGSGYISKWSVFMTCNSCEAGVVAEVFSSSWKGPGNADRWMNLSKSPSDTDTRFKIDYVIPPPPSHAAPDHVPEKIAAAYIEASENLHRKKHETSQMLSRKALDLATKRLLPDSKRSLYHRIEELMNAGKITPEMGEWAHIVRDEGNGSVHDEVDVTREDAAELLAFTETFLMYAFTLPGMIAKRRQTPDESEQATVDG